MSYCLQLIKLDLLQNYNKKLLRTENDNTITPVSAHPRCADTGEQRPIVFRL